MSFVETAVDQDQTEVAEIRIDPITNHRSLFSKKSFRGNEVIIKFLAKNVLPAPTYLTVQISDSVHIELFPECLGCTNHSCEPNCFFDTTRMEFISLRPILEGEELTFFYPSAEWDMDRAFQCHCGSEQCLGLIKGARYLSEDRIGYYRFTDFIHQKLQAVKS
ncbi:MAG: SET domain-containing protein [Cyclobacteriaceae bacterium]|nr:SET domain-containing protein [Cyclobacteriaceae bacterium]